MLASTPGSGHAGDAVLQKQGTPSLLPRAEGRVSILAEAASELERRFSTWAVSLGPKYLQVVPTQQT